MADQHPQSPVNGKIAIYRGEDRFFEFMKNQYVLVTRKLGKGRVEVFPYIEEEKRFTWISSDPSNKNLEYHPELTYTPERGIHESEGQ